jgi:ribosomal RNA assembly protein
MQSVYIPAEKIKKLRANRDYVKKIEAACHCKIKFEPGDEFVEVDGEPFEEYNGKNIVYAFGRGFEIEVACKLAQEDYYFSSTDLGQIISSPKRTLQVKARIIGKEGRTKRYIEEVTGAKISVYGDTVSFIGAIDEINEAATAINTLIDGGTHRLAYARMEAAHRKNKADAKKAAF